jgi:signal peptidase
VFVLLVIALWPARWGGRSTALLVAGNSMEPTYSSGDVAFAWAQDSYRPGDVVLYRIPTGSAGAGKLVVHRVVGINPDQTLVIQGDNRTNPDSFPVTNDEIVGRVRGHVPKLGLVMWLLSRWYVLSLSIGLFVACLVWFRTPDDLSGIDDSSGIDVATDEVAVPAERGLWPPPLAGAAAVDQAGAWLGPAQPALSASITEVQRCGSLL